MKEYAKNRDLLMTKPREVSVMGGVITMDFIVSILEKYIVWLSCFIVVFWMILHGLLIVITKNISPLLINQGQVKVSNHESKPNK